MNAQAPALADSHAHLHFPEFEGTVGEVIERALAAGVERILTVGTSYEEAVKSLDMARRHPALSVAAAVHPNYVKDKYGGFEVLLRLFDAEPFVAVGETGLDFHWNYTPPAQQEKAFRAHLDLALEKNLPVILHVRDAYERTLEVLDSLERMPRGVFHCFSGTAEFAREALDRGFYISIAGQITFKKADALRAAAATVPLDRLLVETDCPYLAPLPHRGKTNEPAYVRFTAEKLAEVLGVAFAEVARATTANFHAVFGGRATSGA
jgi:TatD DNase family protein